MKIKSFFGLIYFLSFCAIQSNAQWTDDTSINTLVSDSGYFKNSIAYIEDGNGGSFMVYSENHGFITSDDIYAQHIDADGYMLWGSGGAIVCNEVKVQTRAVIMLDGEDGIFVAWTDNRDSDKDGSNGTNNYKPAMARVDLSGNVLWSIVLDDDASYNFAIQPFPIHMISDDQGGAFVCWNTQVQLQYDDTFLQRVDADGNEMWDQDLNLAPIIYAQVDSQLVSDGNGGCFMGWTDQRDNRYDFYIQHVDAAGNILWQQNGLPIIAELNNSNAEYLFLSDGQNGMYLAYLRRIGGSTETDVFAQRIGQDGTELWGENGLSVCSAVDYQSEFKAVADSFNNLFCVWEDDRETENSFSDVYT